MKLRFSLFLLVCVFSICILFPSCEPRTIIETETITVVDTVIVNSIDTLFVSEIDTLFIEEVAEITTFILVRHAEIESTGTDPGLTEEGEERAAKLAEMLSQLQLDRVYSTNFNRTMETAIPIGDSQGLNITNYGGFDHNQVIFDILANVSKGKILIVGHGNTTPNFLNALTGTSDFPELAEDAFDNLYIVSTKSQGDSEVIHLKY